MKHYAVTCVRGHQGNGNNDNTITFYFKATDSYDAMRRGQSMPGVKHSRLPLSVREITEEQYIQNRKVSAYAR